ncbi:hypothetical protein L228DRAFT_275769 [Xylona heveae TC161]|uniref:Uncharacterized protein n=1 Tax=Xylona heveae (strain CBS 132557 / TC161) TaxID=1328760 RepID=A0A165I6Q2_XYLHT|nr:hypothetical protein L228DRAFT_275769 [Xylona heveae TC161]KZF24468.1 hypothetical protein L228DRAFT_275769 [Xylona heveae TC161]
MVAAGAEAGGKTDLSLYIGSARGLRWGRDDGGRRLRCRSALYCCIAVCVCICVGVPLWAWRKSHTVCLVASLPCCSCPCAFLRIPFHCFPSSNVLYKVQENVEGHCLLHKVYNTSRSRWEQARYQKTKNDVRATEKVDPNKFEYKGNPISDAKKINHNEIGYAPTP